LHKDGSDVIIFLKLTLASSGGEILMTVEYKYTICGPTSIEELCKDAYVKAHSKILTRFSCSSHLVKTHVGEAAEMTPVTKFFFAH